MDDLVYNKVMEKRSKQIDNGTINRAIDYILRNIDTELSVDDVAKECGYSKYHLTRMFKEETGEAIYAYIKRMKMERSAFSIKTERCKSITEIGENYGYSASNYATAFRNQFHQSPAGFRKSYRELVLQNKMAYGQELLSYEECCEHITIEEYDDFHVLFERKKGNYLNLLYEWNEFCRKYEYLMIPGGVFIECTMDDPTITDENDCIYELCVQVDREDERLLDFDASSFKTFEGGKFAVFHFRGYPESIYLTYQSVFCNWLEHVRYEFANREIFDIYRRVEEDCYMELDICFPIR